MGWIARRFPFWVSIVLLAQVQLVRADVSATYTVVNDTEHFAGFLYVSFDRVGYHDAVLIDAPPLCSPLAFSGVDHQGPQDLVYFGWPCACIPPGGSVTFTVQTSTALPPLGTSWDADYGSNCPGVVLTSFRVIDLDGDLDGYPDTNEIFDLQVGVSNKWNRDLTGVVLRISTDDPRIDCISQPLVNLGALPANTDASPSASFRLHVHPDAERSGAGIVCSNPGPQGTCSNFVVVPGGCVNASACQRSVLDDYRAELTLSVTADQIGAQTRPQTIPLDLDLNSSQPSAATTTLLEGFESGFSSFQLVSLDNNKASNSGSDGYRCQYSDPDFINSNTYGVTECYLGFAAGQAPVNDWHVHGSASPDMGRTYEGVRSLHYGRHIPGQPIFDTYPLSQMDAAQVRADIHLAARICRDDPGPNKRACNAAADCVPVGGGPCVAASPQLSFKQQASLVDGRCARPGIDRAVVHAQVLGSSIWEKISPYENLYDEQGSDIFSNCTFDPIDDGNNEDSYFDPTDPARRLGPSSTCYPEFVFSHVGDTGQPFGAANIGDASDGPGLQGSVGPGTWIESAFDLSRFRGRSIHVRYLITSMNLGESCTTWGFCFSWAPEPCDDGWYIDDLRVTQTLGATSATVAVDGADNDALVPGNIDHDPRGDECDCAPQDPAAFALPTEVGVVTVAGDKRTVSWTSVAAASGSGTVYDVARGGLNDLPVGGAGAEICLAAGASSPTAMDPAVPAGGAGFWYVVRGRNACGAGTYGFASNGSERQSSVCP